MFLYILFLKLIIMPLKYPYLDSDTNQFIKDSEHLAINTFRASALTGDHIFLQGFISGIYPFNNLSKKFNINPDTLKDKYVRITGIGRSATRGTIAVDNVVRNVLGNVLHC